MKEKQMSENQENSVVKNVLKIFTNEWNKQVILYGPPGTSKKYSATIIDAALLKGVSKDTIQDNMEETDLLKKIFETEEEAEVYAEAKKILNENEKKYTLIQFHPSYSYEDFVRGITVKVGNGDKVTYEVERKVIDKFCDDNKEEKGPIVMIIDEINRAPLASVLGELIYGLEYRGEEISTPYELGGTNKIEIPSNLYIIGTMNTADRSIGSIDYAVRRRFAFVQVKSEKSKIKDSWKKDKNGSEFVGKCAARLYARLMDENGIFAEDMLQDTELDVEDIKIGHTYFLGKDDEGMEYLKYRIRYQIWPIYEEYIKDGIISNEGKARFAEILEKKDFGKNFKSIAEEIRGKKK